MRLTLLLSLCFLAILSGCDSSTEPAQPAQGTLRLLLVDRPAEYEAVNIVVTEVSIHSAGADTTSGWSVLSDSVRTFDLLTLRNGAAAILGEASLDAGQYTQIRLRLADSCTVTVDGETHALEVPSGTQSGLKLNHPFEIAPSILYELILDFDASRSIHVTGNDRYRLSPVIRVVASQVSGTISGIIDPASVGATVFTVVGADTASTLADTATGQFMLMGLPADFYSVHIAPATPTYRDTTLAGVEVVAAQDTDLGTITLSTR